MVQTRAQRKRNANSPQAAGGQPEPEPQLPAPTPRKRKGGRAPVKRARPARPPPRPRPQRQPKSGSLLGGLLKLALLAGALLLAAAEAQMLRDPAWRSAGADRGDAAAAGAATYVDLMGVGADRGSAPHTLRLADLAPAQSGAAAAAEARGLRTVRFESAAELARGTVDCALSVGAEAPDEATLRELKRALRPQGRLVVQADNAGWLLAGAAGRAGAGSTEAEVREAMAAVGLKVTRVLPDQHAFQAAHRALVGLGLQLPALRPMGDWVPAALAPSLVYSVEHAVRG